MEYLKTAAATAKINGCTPISNKIIADFSDLKKAIDDHSDDINNINNINISLDALYTRAVDEFTETLKKDICGDIEFINFFIGEMRCCIDVTFNVVNVYDPTSFKRKFKHITIDGVRLAIYNSNGKKLLSFSHNEENFKIMFRTTQEAFTA